MCVGFTSNHLRSGAPLKLFTEVTLTQCPKYFSKMTSIYDSGQLCANYGNIVRLRLQISLKGITVADKGCWIPVPLMSFLKIIIKLWGGAFACIQSTNDF